MSRVRRGLCSQACSAGVVLAVALVGLALVPTARGAADDLNLTGLVYLADGTPLFATPWGNNTQFAVWVNHSGSLATAWRYPAAPSWYVTSGGTYSVVLPAAQKDVSWSNGDPYRVEFDVSAITGVAGRTDNASSHGTGDSGEFSAYGSVDNALVWTPTDNWQRWDVVVLTTPDLYVNPNLVATTPPIVTREGVLVTIEGTVQNLGSREATNVAVRFTDGLPPSGTPIGSDLPIWAIQAGGSQWMTQDWIAGPPATHRLCVVADPDAAIRESDEGNNVGCADLLVEPRPPVKPDYVPIDPQPAAPVGVGLGIPLSFSLVVRNDGNATAAVDATLAFFNESTPATPFVTFAVAPLAPGGTSGRFTAGWASPSSPGTYRVVADVDFAGDLDEWNETNNRFAWAVAVVAGPSTRLFVGAPSYTAARTYVTSATSLSFSVADPGGAGIRGTEYRVDNATWVNYSAAGPFRLSGEGPHFLEWRSEDWAGNVEAVRSAVLLMDDMPPITEISPPTGPYTPGTVFTLAPTDSGSGVARTECRLDGGPWTLYGSGFSLSAGDHVVQYRSVDHLNNTETEHEFPVSVEAPPAETNWKPIVATLFAVLLLAVGAWSARRRPWRGEASKKRVGQAFAAVSLPFVLAEAGTGVVSHFTGLLSIPPVAGLGVAADSAILVMGVVMAVYRGRRVRPSGPDPASR